MSITIDGLRDDHQLLDAYVHGDEQAFETLVGKYFRMVYTVAARQTSDSHLAEDIAQSVFLILSRKARGFSSKASVPGWLLRTTRFVCRDAIKMRRRRAQNEQRLAMTLEEQVEAKTEASTMEVLLHEALQALRPDEQAGIVARFVEGKDFQEIGQMFAISEEAARKRTARCLAKLQAFMTKRGAIVSAQVIPGLLLASPVHEAATQALQPVLQGIQGAWKAKVAAPHMVALVNHAERWLRWRFLAKLTSRVGLPAVLVLVGIWAIVVWNRPVSDRIENLGRAWGAFDMRVAQHRQFLIQTPPTAPNYQARVQAELGAISRESARLIGDLNPLLGSPDGRTRLAQFLTADLAVTLNLDAPERARVLAYLQGRLAQGPTLNSAMKVLAESTSTEAAEIKALISPAKRQRFDEIYGADGVLLFSYAKAVALGRIGD